MNTGNQLDLTIGTDSTVRIEPQGRSMVELFGCLPTRRSVSVEDMHEEILEQATKEDARVRRLDPTDSSAI